MKKYHKKAVMLLALTLIVGCFAGFPTKVSAAALNASKLTYTCADKGKTKTLKVTGSKNGKYKHNGNWYTINWSSSNKSVATVDQNGKVKVGKAGSATITASIIYGSYGPKFTKDIGKCKVKVGHVYTKTTEHREPTIYQSGGDVTKSVCKGCGYTKETISNKEDFVYTEEFLLAEMDKIYRLSQEECKLVTEEIDFEGDVILHEGFRTTKDFLNFLIEKKYVPSSVLNVAKTTTATVRGFDYGKAQSQCEDGVHSFESILSGYQRYEPIRRYGGYGDKNFEMRSDLKAGDILKTQRHAIIFTHYTREGGKVFINGYSGANGEIVKEEFECVGSKPVKDEDGDNVIGYMDKATVFRLPNYK